MNVFDLIVKQFNNEDMPKHIKINTLNYTYDYNRKTYKSEYGEFMSFDFTNNVLNMQVELIEDEVDIDNIEELATGYSESGADTDIINYINDKIVPGMKQLNKKVNELESLNIEINEKDINEAIKKAREQRNKEIKSIKEK